jgi:hypothetical protein
VDGHRFPPPLDREYPIRDGRIHTRSLEAHVVDHCNLTCAECCSLSPWLPRWLAEPEALARDLALAQPVLAPRMFKLVGGEPLLHPRLVDCLEIARRAQIAPAISITTNGLLLPRMPDAMWEAVDALTISLYPEPALPEATVALIEDRAARFGVTLNWKRQDQFVRMNRATRCDDDAETAAIWDQCWIRERCHMLREGVFYTCTRPPHLARFYGARVELGGDGLRLHAGATLRDELHAYLQRERPLEACAHCFGGAAELVPHRQLARAEVLQIRRTRSFA